MFDSWTHLQIELTSVVKRQEKVVKINIAGMQSIHCTSLRQCCILLYIIDFPSQDSWMGMEPSSDRLIIEQLDIFSLVHL